MYDYMKALQRQFETNPRSIQELANEVSQAHKEHSLRLAKEDRKLLLRLVARIDGEIVGENKNLPAGQRKRPAGFGNCFLNQIV